jgi:hypothetical protein
VSEPPVLADANASFVTERLLVGGDLDGLDEELTGTQLRELVAAGVTHLLDCRLEADDSDLVADLEPQVNYLWLGIDDAGQRVPVEWFDTGVAWALDALEDPDAIVLTHCHMGINRGPSMGFAVLLAFGLDPVDAIAAIRDARPQAYVAYAEDALRWHHERSGASTSDALDDRIRLERWREDNPIDLVRIIADRRALGY